MKKVHWTQRPENAAKLASMHRKASRTRRREHASAPAGEADDDAHPAAPPATSHQPPASPSVTDPPATPFSKEEDEPMRHSSPINITAPLMREKRPAHVPTAPLPPRVTGHAPLATPADLGYESRPRRDRYAEDLGGPVNPLVVGAAAPITCDLTPDEKRHPTDFAARATVEQVAAQKPRRGDVARLNLDQAEAEQRRLLDHLGRHGPSTVRELVAAMGASTQGTIHRLQALNRQRLAKVSGVKDVQHPHGRAREQTWTRIPQATSNQQPATSPEATAA